MNLIISTLSVVSYPFVIVFSAFGFVVRNPYVAMWAIIGGFVPAIIWLFFWLQEDNISPEPRKVIVRSFVSGMIAVFIAVFFERLATCFGHIISCQEGLSANTFQLVLIFAVIEELFKYWAAHFSCLRTKHNDEPIDPVIYLISSALGFAALENTFFLNTPLLQDHVLTGLITGNLRFIGANLLHVISSATVGIFIAFAYYKPKWQKRLYLVAGLLAAIMLHTLFNFSIINDNGQDIILIFGLVWLAVIVLILMFERIKKIKR